MFCLDIKNRKWVFLCKHLNKYFNLQIIVISCSTSNRQSPRITTGSSQNHRNRKITPVFSTYFNLYSIQSVAQNFLLFLFHTYVILCKGLAQKVAKFYQQKKTPQSIHIKAIYIIIKLHRLMKLLCLLNCLSNSIYSNSIACYNLDFDTTIISFLVTFTLYILYMGLIKKILI